MSPTGPILFYTPGTCSLACLVALEWRGTPYTLCRVEKEVRSSESFLRINPRGQVPALRTARPPDDAARVSVIVEANAILEHIAAGAADADGLLPGRGHALADLTHQWLAYLASGFHPPFWPYFRPDRYTTDVAHEASVKDAAVASIRRELAVVDHHLEKNEFLLGSRRSLLDPYLFAMLRWANPIVKMSDEYPNLWRLQKLVAADRAVRFGVAVERSQDAATVGTACQGHVTLNVASEGVIAS